MESEGLLIALAVLAWLLWRQLQVRELRRDRSMLLPLILTVAGVVEIVDYGLLYLGVTLAVQRACLNDRARRHSWSAAPRPSGT